MNYTEARNRMVDEQLAARGINDPGVLEAFRKVERHLFVPEGMREEAYSDSPLPIGGGQTISQPYMVALMTQSLGLGGGEKVLEIGTGSGYQAAILAQIAEEVFTVERDSSLQERARRILVATGSENVRFRCSDGTLGWREEAPFDRIIVTAASPGIPEPLKEQLADGGKLLIPVGTRYSQSLMEVERSGGTYRTRDLGGCVFVPLIGEHGWEE
ncbi:MAG: protein-L-isoaspartate(D-aspartate) O-methyltransferase [Candidatus Omnitrophica bacterium]|nr:protein-L-isoaspartate(D-aspartate) O-methyltransferase [Candidatus Omnitrophota bacterium]